MQLTRERPLPGHSTRICRKYFLRAFVGSAIAITFAAAEPIPASVGEYQSRNWDVETSVNLRYILDPSDYKFIGANPAQPVLASPDGARFVTLTRRGILATDETEFELRVYASDDVLNRILRSIRKVEPIVSHITRTKNSLYPAIQKIQWSDDGSAVTYAGPIDSSISVAGFNFVDPIGLYRLDTTSGKTSFLSPGGRLPNKRGSFLLANMGMQSVFVGRCARDNSLVAPIGYPSEVVDPERYFEIKRSLALETGSNATVFVHRNGQFIRVCMLDPRFVGDKILSPFASISPSGRYVLIAGIMGRAPNSMNSIGELGETLLHDVMIADCDTGVVQEISVKIPPTIPESLMDPQRIKWSADGTRVAINGGKLGEQTNDTLSCDAIVYTNKDNIWKRYRSERGSDSEKIPTKKSEKAEALVKGTESTKDERRKNGVLSWKSQEQIQIEESQSLGQGDPSSCSWMTYPKAAPVVFPNGLEVMLDESANNPQQLLAKAGQNHIVLIPRDPALADVRIAEGVTIQWNGISGKDHFGLLTVPKETAKRPVPLVVQLYYYMPNVFRPDGNTPSGFAKQALVARGIAVLEVSAWDTMWIPGRKNVNQEDQIQLTIENIQDAIKVAARDYNIDEQRVGIIGFSHTCLVARAFLFSGSGCKVLAGVANDGYSASIYQYYNSIASDAARITRRQSYELAMYLGGPPWERILHWSQFCLELASVKAKGALLEISHSGLDDGAYLSTAMPFLASGRICEFMLISSGSHNLERPRERFDSLTANSDWMCFWLSGSERLEPHLAGGETKLRLQAKFTRWRKMKDEWERQQAWEAAGHPAGSIPAKDFKVEPAAAK